MSAAFPWHLLIPWPRPWLFTLVLKFTPTPPTTLNLTHDSNRQPESNHLISMTWCHRVGSRVSARAPNCHYTGPATVAIRLLQGSARGDQFMEYLGCDQYESAFRRCRRQPYSRSVSIQRWHIKVGHVQGNQHGIYVRSRFIVQRRHI